MKASFKLKKLIDPKNVSRTTALSLFASLIKPISLYDSEVWGTPLVVKNLIKTFDKFNHLPSEKMHLSYNKYILGVHKNTTNAALPR